MFGFYVNWDPASMVSLRMHLAHLTHLVPEWLILRNAKGDLDDQSDPTVIAIAAQAKLPILALVTNYRDGWQAGDVRKILHDAEPAAISSTTSTTTSRSIISPASISTSKNSSRATAMPSWPSCASSAPSCMPAGLLLTESVPIDDPAYDLQQLARGERLRRAHGLRRALSIRRTRTDRVPGVVPEADRSPGTDRPPAKMVIGIGNYGYDWTIGDTGSAETKFGEVMSRRRPITRRWIGMRPWAIRCTATRPAGRQHEVWFLDAVTALNEARGVAERRLPRCRAVAAGSRRSGFVERAAAQRLARRRLRSEAAVRADRARNR